MLSSQSMFAALLAVLSLTGCYDRLFPASASAHEEVDADEDHTHDAGACAAESPTVSLAVAPGHLHPGVAATLTFTVEAPTGPVADLSPTLSYTIDGDAPIGPLPLEAGESAGMYTIKRTLAVAGTYALEFEYSPCDTPETVPFELVVGGSH